MTASDKQPFRYPSGQLRRQQSIFLASQTQERLRDEVAVRYHFRQLWQDGWLPSQIALVQIRSVNPPILLLKPFRPNSADGLRWEELRSWLNHRGIQSDWSATISAEFIEPNWPCFPFPSGLTTIRGYVIDTRPWSHIPFNPTSPDKSLDSPRSERACRRSRRWEEKGSTDLIAPSETEPKPANGKPDVNGSRKLLAAALDESAKSCKTWSDDDNTSVISLKTSPSAGEAVSRGLGREAAEKSMGCCENGEAAAIVDKEGSTSAFKGSEAHHRGLCKQVKFGIGRNDTDFAPKATVGVQVGAGDRVNKASESATQNDETADRSLFRKHLTRKRRFSEVEAGPNDMNRNQRARSMDTTLAVQLDSQSPAYFDSSVHMLERSEKQVQLDAINQPFEPLLKSAPLLQGLPPMPDQGPICFGCGQSKQSTAIAFCAQCSDSLNSILMASIVGQEIRVEQLALLAVLRRLLMP